MTGAPARSRRGGTHLLALSGERHVALRVADVVEVLPMLELEPLPGGPPSLLGFANLRRSPLPVFSLRGLFGETPGGEEDGAIVVARAAERAVGLVVRELLGLATPDGTRAPRADDGVVCHEVVDQVAIVGGHVALVLRPEAAARALGAPQGSAP